MAVNFVTSGAATNIVGVGMNSSIPNSAWAEWVSGAEAWINVRTKKNWTDLWSSLNDDVKYVLSEVGANIVASKAITYDMSDFQSRTAAETKLDVLRDNINTTLNWLEEQEIKDFMEE